MTARNRMDALVHGENVTYHPVGDTPISSAVGAGSPDEQVIRRINGLLHEGRAGKPHLLPQAEELLRQWHAYKSSGAKEPQAPAPLSAADHPLKHIRQGEQNV